MKPIERVLEIIKYEGISISAFEKSVNLSNNSIQTAIKRKSNLKDETLNSILNSYPNIDPEWLLTGKGERLRQVKEKETSLSNFSPSEIASYIFDNKEVFKKDPVYLLLIENETKDRVIEKLQKEKERLLKKKDQLIK